MWRMELRIVFAGLRFGPDAICDVFNMTMRHHQMQDNLDEFLTALSNDTWEDPDATHHLRCNACSVAVLTDLLRVCSADAVIQCITCDATHALEQCNTCNRPRA